MKILCTGDIHIGRRSSRIPERHDSERYSSAAAWDEIVECALRERVDLVAISGDVVDRDNRYFEAIGPLEWGLRRLADAGIDAYAVAGNHDFDVLAQLADTGLRLLGQEETWERTTIMHDGRPVLHIDGWSFARQHVLTNPLMTYDPPPADDTPVLGLLHADLDQPNSRYAPIATADLERRPVDIWLLGHIHAPMERRLANGSLVLYPGSPQAMDPGEMGAHGVWLVEIDARRQAQARQIALSRVRYERVEVDLTDASDEAEINRRVVEAMRQAGERVAQEQDLDLLELLSCRLVVTGRTPLYRQVPGILQRAQEDLELSFGRATATIEKIEDATAPAIDLAQLALSHDPPGEIARLLLALDEPELPATYEPLIDNAVAKLRDVHGATVYLAVSEDPPPDQELARHYLRAEGMSLLETLLSQKESA